MENEPDKPVESPEPEGYDQEAEQSRLKSEAEKQAEQNRVRQEMLREQTRFWRKR